MEIDDLQYLTENEIDKEKATIEENIKFLNEQLQEYFNEFRKSWKMNRTSLEKEMKIILEWYQQYENLLGS